MRKFKHNESVVIDFADGGSASGKIVNAFDDDIYLVAFGFNGISWKHGFYHGSQLTAFDGALFMVTEPYQPSTLDSSGGQEEC